MTMAVVFLLFIVTHITVGLATETGDDFKQAMLDKYNMLEIKFTDLERRLAETEVENRAMKEQLSKNVTKRGRSARFVQGQEVAFSAYVSRHLKGLSAYQTIVFDSTGTNIGNSYDKSTGIFHAPASGTYLLFANILSERSNEIETQIVADGHVISSIYSGAKDFHGPGSNLVIAHLNSGTNVLVKIHDNYGTDFAVHCCWSTFSGYLLREDDDGGLVVVG